MSAVARIGEIRFWLRDRLPLPLFHCLFVVQILLLTNARIYRNFFYFLLLIPFLFALQREDFSHLARSWILRFCLAYLAILWLTLFWGPPASAEQHFQIGRYFAANFVFVALTAWLVARDERHLDRLLAWMAWAALITAVYSMITFYWSGPFDRPLVTPQWSNPNAGAAIFALVAIAAITGPATRHDWSKWRWAYVTIAAVLIASVVLTGSRASIVSLVAAALACLALIGAWKTLAAGIAAGVVIVGFIVAGVEGYGLRFLRGGYGGRFEVWSHYWSLAREHLLLGHGLLNDSSYTTGVNVVIYGPHNLLLSALLYGGLPAALLLICLFVALAAACFLYARRTGRLAPFALTVFLVTHGIFESGWLRSSIDWQWLYLWLPIGIGAGVELRARRSSN